MLNKDGMRELCYITKVDKITPIEGADNIELAHVLGWTCIVKKGEFKEGNLGVYFEIDSKLPETEWSEFLANKHYKVKTMKLNKFKVISQGLLLPASAFGGICYQDGDGQFYLHFDKNSWFKEILSFKEGDFLTEKLKVTYSVEEDNKRKGSSPDKYKKMASRHPKLFQNPIIKWFYRKTWGKKMLFIFFGKKKDKRGWPVWVIKTDEERIQNMPYILQNKEPWFATEKIDGTSTTFTMRGRGKKKEFYICSRNVVFDKPDKNCYYDTNVYVEMAEKYGIENVLLDIMNNDPTLDFVTIQGETYGKSIQKRDYGMQDHDIMIFNVILGYKGQEPKRLNPREMTDFMNRYNVPCVPIVDEKFILPDTVEELLDIATGKSAVDGGMREGLVFRSADGKKSFKAVSNEFLLKYHNG